MSGAAPNLNDYSAFYKQLSDPATARDFLLHALGLGYEIFEVKSGMDVRTLPDDYTVELARKYWGEVFLTEYSEYGMYPQ